MAQKSRMQNGSGLVRPKATQQHLCLYELCLRNSFSRVSEREERSTMSKKNNLAKRRKQHEFDLKREKEEKENKAKKLQAKNAKMKVDGSDKKAKRKGAKFHVGKKLKTKLSALAKAKAVQAMELDK